MPSPPPSSSTIPQLKILRAYAKLNDASLLTTTLPPTVYFSHTRHTLTIFDAYPKALFHFLVLPRLSPRIATTTTSSSRTPTEHEGDERREPDSEVESEVKVVVADRTEDLTSLRTLLLLLQRADPDSDAWARVKGTLSVLSDESTRLQSQIEREMQTHYGFKWPIWIGFHAIPSMEHLHLHVISSDLISPSLKTKRHYNTFNPRTGFFLPLADVCASLDDEHQLAKMVASLAPKNHELRLKDALVCFHCGETMKNMPALKDHLQKEFDALRKREIKSASAS
ncbi:hypothetical protein BGY98DRAFT_1094043 [Russula aff. rugulosa BPL654]|nr:hypothetical protein BGY98DRAFT_1094043 [Russula aff. rugulosa BPL654]